MALIRKHVKHEKSFTKRHRFPRKSMTSQQESRSSLKRHLLNGIGAQFYGTSPNSKRILVGKTSFHLHPPSNRVEERKSSNVQISLPKKWFHNARYGTGQDSQEDPYSLETGGSLIPPRSSFVFLEEDFTREIDQEELHDEDHSNLQERAETDIGAIFLGNLTEALEAKIERLRLEMTSFIDWITSDYDAAQTSPLPLTMKALRLDDDISELNLNE